MTAGQFARTPPSGQAGEQFREYLRRSKAVLEPAIEAELRRILGNIVAGDGALVESLNQGKKLRGCLTCLIGQALGATPDSTLPRAVAVEMLQAASLIHDDYVDQDRVRRDRPAIWTTEGSRRAVLIGDVVFASAIHMMCSLSKEDCAAISRAVAMVSAGALREPLDPATLARLIEDRLVDGNLYREIIHLKTGILFGAACELGAISAGAEEGVRMAARSYGLRIGEAYQIADDLKEVEQHINSRYIEPLQMMPVAPAFLCFEPEMRTGYRSMPEKRGNDDRRRSAPTDDGGKELYEVRHRRAVAVGRRRDSREACRSCTESLLALAAPWIAIDMFNET